MTEVTIKTLWDLEISRLKQFQSIDHCHREPGTAIFAADIKSRATLTSLLLRWFRFSACRQRRDALVDANRFRQCSRFPRRTRLVVDRPASDSLPIFALTFISWVAAGYEGIEVKAEPEEERPIYLSPLPDVTLLRFSGNHLRMFELVNDNLANR